jgi:hypothetical protein
MDGKRVNEPANQTILFWQDEILQVMYWMRGEGFGDPATEADLRKFLHAPGALFDAALQRLAASGLLRMPAPGAYQLTEPGVHEGRRRFADEFEGLLAPGHYECNDPDCDCHEPDSAGACLAREAAASRMNPA